MSTILLEAIADIRDKNTQAPVFRSRLRKIGRYLAYEAAKSFDTIYQTIETPLSMIKVERIKNEIVIISILRAALPMVEGVLSEFENASMGIVSASREEMTQQDGRAFNIESNYIKLPSLDNKIVVIVDPMLATGSTIKYLLQLINKSKPVKIVVLCAIAADYGINAIEEHNPKVEIYAGVVDPTLNGFGYIVPGLGDAGDRAFNTPH